MTQFQVGDTVRPTEETLNHERSQEFLRGLLISDPQRVVEVRRNPIQETVHNDSSLTEYKLENGLTLKEWELEEV